MKYLPFSLIHSFYSILFVIVFFCVCVCVCACPDDIMKATALQKEILSNGGANTATATASATSTSGEKTGEALIFTDSNIISRQSISIKGGEEGINTAAVVGVDGEAEKKKKKDSTAALPTQVTYATRPKKVKKSV